MFTQVMEGTGRSREDLRDCRPMLMLSQDEEEEEAEQQEDDVCVSGLVQGGSSLGVKSKIKAQPGGDLGGSWVVGEAGWTHPFEIIVITGSDLDFSHDSLNESLVELSSGLGPGDQ